MLSHAVITLLTTLTIMQCLMKWKFFDWYGAKLGHVRWLPDAGCYLCFSFWLSIVVAAIYALLPQKWFFLPFSCAGLINVLLTFLKALNGNDRTS